MLACLIVAGLPSRLRSVLYALHVRTPLRAFAVAGAAASASLRDLRRRPRLGPTVRVARVSALLADARPHRAAVATADTVRATRRCFVRFLALALAARAVVRFGVVESRLQPPGTSRRPPDASAAR